MDIISFNEAATANGRIEKFNTNPDSNSGVLTQPKVIEAGETVTIKSGRQAILADTVINGDLVIEAGGDVFVPSGATVGDLEDRIEELDLLKFNKSDVAYNANTSSFIPNTLTGGAIFERGSNANGEYIKYADGTVMCITRKEFTSGTFIAVGNSYVFNIGIHDTPASFISGIIYSTIDVRLSTVVGNFWGGNVAAGPTQYQGRAYTTSAYTIGATPLIATFILIGKWK